MPLTVRFVCETCRNKNKHRRENQPPVETEYTQFSDAVNHLIHASGYGERHDMDVIIEESDVR